MKIKRWISAAIAIVLLMGALPGALAIGSTDTFCPSRYSRDNKHNWTSWEVEKEATCTSEGQSVRECRYCGHEQYKTIPMTSHSWGKWKTTKEATCTKKGEQVRKCKVCGKKDTRSTDKKPHDYGNWTVTKEATCTEKGARTRKCRDCGHVDEGTIAMLPHTWGEWEIIVEATDHSVGTRAHTCQVCGARETEDYDPEGTLRRGDKGDAVKELQQGLICYGALKGRADGDFGKGTESAVKSVQVAEGLAADGVAWPQTQALLGHRFGEWETISELSDFSAGIRQRTCARCGYVEREEKWPEPMYRRGDKGDGVKEMQEALNAEGYDCGKPDGDFGRRTEKAVSAIESDNGIEPDGIAWPGVLKLLGLGGTAPDLHLRSNPTGDGEPSVQLTHTAPGVREFVAGDTIEVEMFVTNTGSKPVNLKKIDVRATETFSNEAWMSGPLEPGVPYKFTYRIRMDGDDTKPGYAHREPCVYVVDPITNHQAYDFEDVFVGRKVNGPRLAVMHDDAGGLTGTWGKTVPVTVHVMNCGTVALKDLQFTFKTGKGKETDNDYVEDLSDPALTGHMAPGDVLTLTYRMFVDSDDVEEGSAGRFFTATAAAESGAGKPKDTFYLGVPVSGELPPKVAIVKAETDPRPRPEGYMQDEKISYTITATNNTDKTIAKIELYDPLCDDQYDCVGTITALMPGRSDSRSFEYTVLYEDAKRGYVESAAKGIVENGTDVWDESSDEVRTPCVLPEDITVASPASGEPKIADLVLTVTPDKDKKVVKEGEAIWFKSIVKNEGGADLYDEVTQPYDGQGKKRTPYVAEKIPAGGHVMADQSYVFSAQDAADKNIKLRWEAVAEDASGNPVEAVPVEIEYEVVSAYDWVPAEEDDTPLEITKTVAGGEDQVFHLNDEITFEITVTNTRHTDLTNVEITDFPNGTSKGTALVKNYAIPAHESRTLEYKYTVTEPDVVRGYVTNRARVWDGIADGDGHYTMSEIAKATIGPSGNLQDPLQIVKTVAGGDGQKFQLNDVITFDITVYNPKDIDLEHVEIYDYPNGTSKGVRVGEDYPPVPSHESITRQFEYTVTEDDVSRGYVTNQARVWDCMGDGKQHYTYSDEIKVYLNGTKPDEPVAPPDEPSDEPLKVIKTIVGGYDQVYQLNDTITYRIDVMNNTDEAMSNLAVYDHLNGADFGETVAEGLTIAAHDSKTLYFTHVVDESDVDRTFVENRARVWPGTDNSKGDVWSETVKADVGGAPKKGVTVVKAAGAPADPNGFVEGETIHYDITVYNDTDEELTEVEVYDPLKGENEDMLVDLILSIPPHSSETVGFDYVVDKDDMDAGAVTNTAKAVWFDGDGEHEEPSNTVTVDVQRPQKRARGVTMTKTVENLPTRGFFIESEVVDFAIRVDNNTGWDIYDVKITDPLSTKPGNLEDTFPVIPAGGGGTIHLMYTVTAMDIGTPIVNIAYGEYWSAVEQNGKAVSNRCLAPTGEIEEPFGVITGAEVAKKETSKPKNGKYYVRGEKITYEINVHNSGETVLSEVIVYDTLAGGSGEIASIENFYPDDSRTYTFSHTVGKSDVKKGKVINYAWIEWEIEGYPYKVWSDPVISPVGEDKPAPGPAPKGPDCCVRTAILAGDSWRAYTLDYCSEHKPVADAVAKLVEAADTDEKKLDAWRQATDMWTEALNAEYDELMAGLGADEKTILIGERAMFFAQLACRRDALAMEYPDDPAAVERLVSEQLMNKTADLCYEAHTAPGERADSLARARASSMIMDESTECARGVEPTATGARYAEILCVAHRAAEAASRALIAEDGAEAWQEIKQIWIVELDGLTNERYLAASGEDRQTIAAERIAFGRWLKERERFLNLLYPGRSDLVDEVMAQTVRARVLDLCTRAE